MAADEITLQRIKLMHPTLREQLEKDYLECNNKILGKGVRLRLTHTLRTIDEQNALYAQGRTKPGSIVTNAKGGSSYHNFGLAFDIVLLYDKDDNGTFETASWDTKDKNWKAVVKFFKEKGWFHGGDFKSFKDEPHFEKTFGYTTKQLLTRIPKGEIYPKP